MYRSASLVPGQEGHRCWEGVMQTDVSILSSGPSRLRCVGVVMCNVCCALGPGWVLGARDQGFCQAGVGNGLWGHSGVMLKVEREGIPFPWD